MNSLLFVLGIVHSLCSMCMAIEYAHVHHCSSPQTFVLSFDFYVGHTIAVLGLMAVLSCNSWSKFQSEVIVGHRIGS